ncbi:MAG: hypothetical protein ACPG8A_04310 [Psychrobium sp.]
MWFFIALLAVVNLVYYAEFEQLNLAFSVMLIGLIIEKLRRLKRQ